MKKKDDKAPKSADSIDAAKIIYSTAIFAALSSSLPPLLGGISGYTIDDFLPHDYPVAAITGVAIGTLVAAALIILQIVLIKRGSKK